MSMTLRRLDPPNLATSINHLEHIHCGCFFLWSHPGPCFLYSLRIIGPSKLAILRTLPLLYRFVHPSIGGSKILRVQHFKPLLIHQVYVWFTPINSHHSPGRPATSHHRSSDQSPTKRSLPPDLMSWDHSSGAILEAKR